VEPTKLHYSAETASGEDIGILSIVVEQFGQSDGYGGWPIPRSSRIVFEIAAQATEFAALFGTREKISFLVETTNSTSFAFDGYMEEIEQSCNAHGPMHSKITVRAIGPVTCYYDVVPTPIYKDVFDRKHMRSASKTLGEVLRRVCEADAS
jgi:hypothetical protein